MNKIVAISMVKNEADIIESFVRHTLSFADELIIVDHCSTDATRKILELLQAEGLPLTIELFQNPAHLQAEVMNDLMYRAIEERQADIVVPLDADEFLLYSGTNYSVREILQLLPLDQVFVTNWVYCRPVKFENEPDIFLLNRDCYRKKEPEELKKCFLGKKAVTENNLRLAQGNHHVCIGDSNILFEKITDPGLYFAHFNWRSEMQLLSKALSGWLTNVARYSKYTSVAYHWKEKFNQFCEGKETGETDFDIDDYEMIGPLQNKKVELRYGGLVKTEAMQNVLLAAENIAHSIAVRNTLEHVRAVTVMLLLSEDREAVKVSLESVKCQTFPRIEVLLLDFTGRNVVLGEETMAAYQTAFPVKYLSVAAYGNELMQEAGKQSHGEFVQLLQSGDVLDSEKILTMVLGLDNNLLDEEMAYCDSVPTRPEYFVENTIVRKGETDYSEVKKDGLMRFMARTSVPLSGYIAGFLFTRKFLEKNDWLAASFVGGKLMLFSLYRQILAGEGYIGIVRKRLLSCSDNCAETYIWYQIEARLYIDELKAEGKVGDAEYEQICGIQREIANGLIENKAEVPQDLFGEYLKIVGVK